MSTTGDWLPASRSGKLAMCRAWIAYITAELRRLIRFDYGDAGKTAYIAVQIESGIGKQGKAGPMVQAVIP
ncbi:MAG: hypothetical protein LBB43_07450 [Spirochaetaceae bacterium]|nr:hypothetical protein [Spirochaetaceae bacterium]